MARQSVTTAARDDAKSRLGIDDGARHLVHRTVTAHGYDHVHPLFLALGSNFLGMSGILRFLNLIGKFLFVKNLLYEFRYVRFVGCARGGIHDEHNSLHDD